LPGTVSASAIREGQSRSSETARTWNDVKKVEQTPTTLLEGFTRPWICPRFMGRLIPL
jgi:hypothetical protein